MKCKKAAKAIRPMMIQKKSQYLADISSDEEDFDESDDSPADYAIQEDCCDEEEEMQSTPKRSLKKRSRAKRQEKASKSRSRSRSIERQRSAPV